MKRYPRTGSRHTAVGAVAAVTATGLACLAGCSSSNSLQTRNAPDSTTNVRTISTGRAQPIPSFLAASILPAPSLSLPLLASEPAGAASLPWLQDTRAQGSGKVTIEVVRGDCTGAPDGYTTSETSSGLVLTVVAEIHKSLACAADVSYGLYELVLPASDAHEALMHGTVQNWEYDG